MPTHDQRYGTRNLPVNLPDEYISALGRAAVELGKRSRSEFVRELLEAGAALMDPALAARLREIRKQFYGAALLLLFLGLMVASWFSHEDLQRRCNRRVNRRGGTRIEDVVEVEEA